MIFLYSVSLLKSQPKSHRHLISSSLLFFLFQGYTIINFMKLFPLSHCSAMFCMYLYTFILFRSDYLRHSFLILSLCIWSFWSVSFIKYALQYSIFFIKCIQCDHVRVKSQVSFSWAYFILFTSMCSILLHKFFMRPCTSVNGSCIHVNIHL